MAAEPSDDDAFCDACTLLGRFARHETSPSAVLAVQERRLAARESALRCYITYDAQGAQAAASSADDAWQADRPKPLLGLTLGVKDLYDVAGLPTTGGSAAYGQEPAVADATVIRRLRDAGAVITGKLNTEELAFGVISAPTRNPYNASRIPGGSSGGSAAALAAGLIQLSVGTDTAGSIRIPAALCGVVGYKPSQGIVPRTGVMPLSDSLDHACPMARTVADVRLLLDVIAGPDPDDPLSLPSIPPAPEPLTGVGVPWAWLRDEVDQGTLDLFLHALALLEQQGLRQEDLDWPPPEEFISLQGSIRAPETYLTHRDAIAERPEKFGPGLVARIAAGRDSSAVDYVAALRERHRLRRELEQDLERRGVGFLALPTTPLPAPPVGDTHVELRSGLHLTVREALIRYTAPFNVTGWPAISLPLGLGRDGLPRGLQLVGRLYDDQRLLDVAERLSGLLPPLPRPSDA